MAENEGNGRASGLFLQKRAPEPRRRHKAKKLRDLVGRVPGLPYLKFWFFPPIEKHGVRCQYHV
jgi:hypothetical protein